VVATALVTVARLGLRGRYAGKVGGDDAGIAVRQSLPDAVRLANAAAALACRRLGGQAGIPTLPEVRAFLAARGQALPPGPGTAGG
jgi:sugar/nucleoside kinase (ribokinase family)